MIAGRPYEIPIRGRKVKFELMPALGSYDIGNYSFHLLTSENGNPVGYLDLYPDRPYGSTLFNTGHLSWSGYMLDNAKHYGRWFDKWLESLGVDPCESKPFKGASSEWGFFINESYRRQGIGRAMMSISLYAASQLSKSVDMHGNEAYFMIHKIVSDFYGRYFEKMEPGVRVNGVELEDVYSEHPSILVFPEFKIPEIESELI